MQEKAQELCGSVERVVFRNEDNGWTVLDVVSHGETHKVIGVLPEVYPGEELRLIGSFVEHPNFGHQFQAQQCEQTPPQSQQAILRYLASGAVKGIGAITASRIVKQFGTDSLRVIEQEPQRLTAIRGITPQRAEEIGREFAAQFGLREVILFLAPYGLTPAEALRCYKKWGLSTIETLQKNPYALCAEGLHIGFERADEIGARMEWPAEDADRVTAGLLHVLRHNLQNGHSCLPVDKLLPIASSMLGVSLTVIEEVFDRMNRQLLVEVKPLGERAFAFLPALYQAESYVAARIRLMAGKTVACDSQTRAAIRTLEKKSGLVYENKQRQAIEQAVTAGIFLLTGGPGTGKTTTLQAIIAVLESRGEKVAVAAPTGRAAKRISELTGYEAKTIHRLLEAKLGDGDETLFFRNESYPLEADTLIVDEMSMVDVLLFESLLRALSPDARLILVGDTDQLPPVGPGSVLNDLIQSGVVPEVRLTEVFRQALESRIVESAHRVVRGQMPDLYQKNGDFFFLKKTQGQAVADTVADLCLRRLPQSYGFGLLDHIQVLCPGRRGYLGSLELNRLLQQQVNPPDGTKAELKVGDIVLREGDKVMQTKNNYDIGWTKEDGEVGSGVFNGDIGVLVSFDQRLNTLSVRFDDRVAEYSFQEARDLELAYAVTVHKSQGSEFDAVVLPLWRTQPQLIYRHLFYTAITRAKSLLVLVGSEDIVRQMVNNEKKTRRFSGLSYFLRPKTEELG